MRTPWPAAFREDCGETLFAKRVSPQSSLKAAGHGVRIACEFHVSPTAHGFALPPPLECDGSFPIDYFGRPAGYQFLVIDKRVYL